MINDGFHFLNMDVLITGITGFIGSHLAEYLVKKELNIFGTFHTMKERRNIEHLKRKISLLRCDIRNYQRIKEIVEEVKPKAIFHLAAQAYVIPSWKSPRDTIDTNVNGTINLFEAVKSAEINPRIIVACSSAAYGYGAKPPFRETDPLLPINLYGVSKAAQDLLCYQYHLNFKLDIIRARIFNTIGPRKEDDACSDFARQIPVIERGRVKPVIYVGNLSPRRDFTDVRDVVEALWILYKKGKAGEAYNICTGKTYSIESILKKLLSFSKKKIKVEQDPKRLRYTDEEVISGDPEKILRLGWKPRTPIENSLKDILEYWRAR